MHVRLRNTLRLVVAVVLGLGAVGLGVLAVSVCFGLTADYGLGGSGDVPLYVAFFAMPVLAATLAAMAWPVRGRAVVRRRVYPAAVVLLAVSLAGSIPAGLWLNESRHAQESRDFRCDDGNVALDRAVRGMPKPVQVYGPVAGSPRHYVAGVDGDGDTAIRAYRAAWRDAGWTFVTDTTTRVAADQGDIRSTIYLDGDQPLLRVEVRDRT